MKKNVNKSRITQILLIIFCISVLFMLCFMYFRYSELNKELEHLQYRYENLKEFNNHLQDYVMKLQEKLTLSEEQRSKMEENLKEVQKENQRLKIKIENQNKINQQLLKEKERLEKKLEFGLSSRSTDSSLIGKKFVMEATAYTATCKGCSGITATGINLLNDRQKKVIAVDPKIIPLGSKVYVEGYGEAIAADTGGAIKGHKIDVHMPTKKDALNWGRKTVTVTILE